MAAPNYEQIQSFGYVSEQLRQAAIEEFTSELHDGMTMDDVIAEATRIAAKYKTLGAELGAQWYDLCTELAGIEAEPAYVSNVDEEAVASRARGYANHATVETVQHVFEQYLANEINESIRTTGTANLWRDYERGLTPGKWARVPVGDTCAWCLMLASQGAWYVSEKTALGESSGHYHDGCNCIAVYHADANSINGYSKLADYKRMYYDAENTRMANASGREPYPEELQERIDAAKAAHREKYDDGLTNEKWTRYNEDMIVMRYKYGLK